MGTGVRRGGGAGRSPFTSRRRTRRCGSRGRSGRRGRGPRWHSSRPRPSSRTRRCCPSSTCCYHDRRARLRRPDVPRPVLPKIRRARALMRRHGVEMWLQVDGGVSADTIERCAEAGADVFVAGSAVYRADDPERDGGRAAGEGGGGRVVSRPATVDDIHATARAMPHVTVARPEKNPVVQADKSFVFPDATTRRRGPRDGERYDDVVVIWVGSEGTSRRCCRTSGCRSSRRRTSTVTRRCCCAPPGWGRSSGRSSSRSSRRPGSRRPRTVADALGLRCATSSRRDRSCRSGA